VILIDILDGSPGPKRGDIVQTNVGNRKERTWLVLKSRKISRKASTSYPRYQVWMARWWHLETELRLALYRSAERNGGQQVISFKRYPAKRRRGFEDYMKGQ
jgi:hypothetical protein